MALLGQPLPGPTGWLQSGGAHAPRGAQAPRALRGAPGGSRGDRGPRDTAGESVAGPGGGRTATASGGGQVETFATTTQAICPLCNGEPGKLVPYRLTAWVHYPLHRHHPSPLPTRRPATSRLLPSHLLSCTSMRPGPASGQLAPRSTALSLDWDGLG